MNIQQLKRMAAGMAFLAVIAAGTPCAAHKVNIYAYRDGETVYVESYFPDGKKVAGAQVEVCDTADRCILTGVTDEKGVFMFDMPNDQDLEIVVTASLGHKVSYLLKKSDRSPVNGEPDAASGKDHTRQAEKFPVSAVFSGIGYIMGIMGVLFFILTKRERKV